MTGKKHWKSWLQGREETETKAFLTMRHCILTSDKTDGFELIDWHCQNNRYWLDLWDFGFYRGCDLRDGLMAEGFGCVGKAHVWVELWWRTVGVTADVVLMITHINRVMKGRIRKILKDKREQRHSLAPNQNQQMEKNERSRVYALEEYTGTRP